MHKVKLYLAWKIVVVAAAAVAAVSVTWKSQVEGFEPRGDAEYLWQSYAASEYGRGGNLSVGEMLLALTCAGVSCAGGADGAVMAP